jgi:hypothetical protein
MSAKEKKNIVGKFLKDMSYGTGVLCRKVSKSGSVIVKGDTWKRTTTSARGFYGTVSERAKSAFTTAKENVSKSVSEMKESFEEGLKSLEEDAIGAAPAKKEAEEKVVKGKTSAPAKKKTAAKSGSKTKAAKPRTKEAVEKEIPSDPELEKEIEDVTKGVTVE